MTWRIGRRAALGALLFAAVLAAAITARVLWVRRALVDETAAQLPRTLDVTRPALDLWRDAYVAQAALAARVAALEPATRIGAVLGAIDTRGPIVGAWAYDSAGQVIAGGAGAPPPRRAAGATRVETGVDAGGVHADVVAPIAAPAGAREGASLGTVVLRLRLTDTTFAMLNPTRAGTNGGRTTLLARLGDSAVVVSTSVSGDEPTPRRAFALGELPPHVRAALGGAAAHGAGRGLYAPSVAYAAAPVPTLGWALVRELRTDALFARVRPAIAVEEVILATIATLAALTIVFLVRAARARRETALAQLRGDFVSAVSHELRTPLAQIRMFAELLRKGSLREPAEADRALGIIEKEAGRLTILVDNILSYTSLRRRQRFVTPLAADVAAEARQVIESFAPLAAERGARVVASLEDGTRARIDAQALRQVLLNFLENAVKYGPKGQTVTVGARHVAAPNGGARVRLWVDDQGAGVPEAERAAVWDAFYRTERAQRSGAGGSGLGLAVVRDLMAQYGGAATVEDAPGGGARFVVELPGLRVS
ncbi:ATP-binding region ATPase domain protein [Gemmatirosa kalamazoonensis]|uniref:histidine kinase n=1 Tax=Gemmatirosa kalamazoonensis TaxID=861299 RepID=W0RCT8_9BACT|nr:HAMP domain-containing sensor histidine kinase [Gemmatirosa kalamazoonensis]AHG88934.1 ATP-binding region ATPase domain protein [Gemmatirosa kalamazoonensis]